MSTGTGAITGYIDVAQIVLYVFWAFFAGLIYYLQKESKREGFPLETDLPSGETRFTPGFVGMPSPKTFYPAHGEPVTVPNARRTAQQLHAKPNHRWLGAPLEPTGNPMLDGVGPGSYADRADVPDRMLDGGATIVPLRVAHGYGVAGKDPDPRGMKVIGADGEVGGTVSDLWIDKAEMIFRYLELTVPVGNAWRQVLLPMNFARVTRDDVRVQSILGHQFAQVPGLRNAEQVTLLEEEKVMAYYGGGTLYASPDRQEPLV
jgi:photosynthetic reaction center H subunit